MNRHDNHKCIIIYFEFSMVNKTSIVSGAISNSLDRYRIRKLESRRLLLPVGEKILLIKDQELLIAKK